MAQFGKDRFPYGYQSSVGMKARDTLHQNTEELASILQENSLSVSNFKVFEMGSGGARNLHYILKKFPGVELHCSDLFQEASVNEMSEEVRSIVNFYEGDNEDIANQHPVKNLDLLLVSDHFMHLQYEKADNIIKKVIVRLKISNKY